jgi:hypothetical protein
MLYQTVHDKSTVTGKTARPPREAYAFIQAIPLLRRLSKTDAPALEEWDVSRQLRQLAELGIRYAVVDKETARPVAVRDLREWFAFQPYHGDDRVLVFRTDPRYGEDIELAETTAEGDRGDCADAGYRGAGARPFARTRGCLGYGGSADYVVAGALGPSEP